MAAAAAAPRPASFPRVVHAPPQLIADTTRSQLSQLPGSHAEDASTQAPAAASMAFVFAGAAAARGSRVARGQRMRTAMVVGLTGPEVTKPVVLHLFGSAASDYYEGVSTVYASQCVELALEHDTYTNVACRVHSDGMWSFPVDLSEEAMEAAEKMPMDQAVLKIKELNPAAAVPHMFCLPGMTTYRAFCDILNIPLVGNPSDVMALSTNKWQSRAVVESFGVKVPEAEIVYKGDVPKMQPPFLVKPCNEDNSQGITLVKEGDDVQAALDQALQFDHELLIERYVPLGREIRVAVLEQADGSFEMLPCLEYFLSEADPIRTAEHKLVTNDDGVPVGLATGGRKCPADIDDVLAAKLKDLAVRSHKALGCQDYSLFDVRVDPQGEPYFIEACLYCSFAPKSVIVAMAAEAGQDQKYVYEMLVNRAISRHEALSGGSKLGMKRQPTAQKDATQESAAEVAPVSPSPAPKVGFLRRWRARGRTVMALTCLWGFTPILGLVALRTKLQHMLGGGSDTKKASRQLRVLVTGGKMSKASAVARACGRAGHKVYTAEIMPYNLCHTRFSRYVSKHYVLPRPTQQPEEWEKVVKGIVAEQDIDLIIPCTAPVESSAYAHLRDSLPPHVRVFAFDGDTSDKLDNKYTFNQVLEESGLACPQTAKMECLEHALEFFEHHEAHGDHSKRFIVKPAVYDPKARTEIIHLPIADKARQVEYLKSRNASPQVPYVIQEVLSEPEYGSYAIFNNGHLTGFEFFKSAASCLVYSQLEKQYEQVLELHAGLGKAMNLTGQLTLDLMHTADGTLVPIECNPRIHSAICTLEDHENLGRALADADFAPERREVVTSRPQTFRYWIMDQVFLKFGFWKPKDCYKLTAREMAKGGDAMLHGDDIKPFLAMYLLQIPSLLLRELVPGTEWLKIDFCIGKIVKEGGD